MSFGKFCLERGGKIIPLLIQSKDLSGPALTNPSVLCLDDKILVNLRNINYTLYHSEKSVYEHFWGPLSYIHPENDLTLRTTNVMCELDYDLNLKNYKKVDTSTLDQKPLWTFIGLEDARLVQWEDKIFLCGVRRDTTTNGEGRMELSEIDPTTYEEVSRYRIPSPNGNKSYCEKNWMPILSKPYEFVKWSNPVEVAKFNPENTTCETLFLGEHTPGCKDWRGGSQVVSWGDYYVAIIHESNLFKSEAGRKNAIYRHRFIVWDREWNRVALTKEFSFLNANIEFCCGMFIKDEYFYITAGIQDNASILIKVHESYIEEFINE